MNALDRWKQLTGVALLGSAKDWVEGRSAPRGTPAAQPLSGSPVILFHCPACGHLLKAAERLAGLPGRCKACRVVFTVPPSSGATGQWAWGIQDR